jgi:hypothetical protein
VRTQIGVDCTAPALISDRRLHRRDTDLALAVIIGIIGNPILLEGLEAILVQLVDALRQLHRQTTIDAVIFVVEGVVALLCHEDGKQVFIRPFTGVADCILPRGEVAYLATHIAHRVDRGAPA